MANRWQEIGQVQPMNITDLSKAIGQNPTGVNARGLSNGFVAFVTLKANTKIRGYTISTGIVLISPVLGPGGIAELAKK